MFNNFIYNKEARGEIMTIEEKSIRFRGLDRKGDIIIVNNSRRNEDGTMEIGFDEWELTMNGKKYLGHRRGNEKEFSPQPNDWEEKLINVIEKEKSRRMEWLGLR